MARELPERGVELVEIARMEEAGRPVSATAVRQLLRQGRWQEMEPLVPAATYAYFSDPANPGKGY